MKLSRGEALFAGLNYTFLALFALVTVYPFLYVLSASLSDGQAVASGDVLLLPKGTTMAAYHAVFGDREIWIGYANTVFYTVVGTAFSLLMTLLGAYPLSKRRLYGGSAIMFFVALTLWVNMSGPTGLIPFYLNLRDLHLLNNRIGMIVPFAIVTFYVFLMITFLRGVPDSLEESAKVDGANDWIILWRIYLPLSVPALTTIGLFYAVLRWNTYFWAMLVLRDQNLLPLQVILKKMIIEMNVDDMITDVVIDYSKQTIIYATIVVSIIPIVLVYPYIQRYFVKGIVVGAVKE